jgi:hypothetical protein
MMTLKTNLLLRVTFFLLAAAGPPAAASDFSCLRALIPATQHAWVFTQRDQFASPELNDSSSAMAIEQWNGNKLVAIFVYTGETAARFTHARVGLAKTLVDLQSLETSWLKLHTLATKFPSLEVFQIHSQGLHARPERLSTKTPQSEIGGWLVEEKFDVKLNSMPIRWEIELREKWARNNNLDSVRFKAWSDAEKECRAVGI